MEDRMLVSGLIAVFIFAGIIGGIAMTGQVIEPGTGDTNPEPGCTEDWSCQNWSPCVDDVQTRSCSDLNQCGTEDSKLPEQQSCVTPETTWELVKQYSGETDRTSKRDPFSASDEWRVRWICHDKDGYINIGNGHAVVNVYRETDDTRIATLLGRCEEGEQTAMFEYTGSFYVEVETLNLNFWSVYIEESN